MSEEGKQGKAKPLFTITTDNIWKITTVVLAIVLLFVLLRGGEVPAVPEDDAEPEPEPTPTPEPTAPTVDMEALADDDTVKGDEDAPVLIVEFSDFQCPYCGKFYRDTLPLLKENYIDTGKVKIIHRDFPLGFHQNAQKAGEASECADDQGKFWEMHDKLYENYQELAVDNLKQYAVDLGLNAEEFNDCLDTGKYADEVKKDFVDGAAAGVSGTPSFFVNGQLLVGAQPYAAFQQAIDAALAAE